MEFTKELSAQSFIFAASELPQGAEPVYDSNNLIYAYTLEGQTYFKNISITTADGFSVAQHFLAPQTDGKTLKIEANKLNRIPFATGEVSKTIIVTLKGDIADKNGISMSVEKSWRYVIIDASDDKATINFTANSTEGVLNAVSGSYSVGQTLNLTFTENADYQFIKWDFDSSIVRIKEPANPDTTITVFEKTNGTQSSQVKAVCAQRPRVAENGFSPVTNGNTASVSKNSPIQISFTQNLPDDEEGKAQLQNIAISMGGTPVNSCFSNPTVSGNKITIAALNENMLDVPAGQTKIVSVSIPSDLYYELDDEDHTKVYYGGKGTSYTYKINESTIEKTIITFERTDAASGDYTKKGDKSDGYSIGETIEISYALNEGYQFNGWKITDISGNPVSSTLISIEDNLSVSTKLYVLEKSDTLITVTADTVLLPAVISRPSSTTEFLASDSIVMDFNMPLSVEDMKYGDGYISLKYGSEEISNLFTEPLLSSDGKTLTLTPKGMQLYNYINSKNTANISVKVWLGERITVLKTINETQYILPLKQNGNSSFLVKYKRLVEEVLPQRIEFFATRQPVTLANASNLNNSNKFTQDEFTTFNQTKVLKNLTRGTVYIYGRYYDADSGANKITLTETHTNRRDGTELSDEPNKITFIKNDTGWTNTTFNGTAQFSEEEQYTCFVITYNLKTDTTKDHNDGAFYFTMQVTDACNNNAQTESFTTIKDTILDISDIDLFTDFSWGGYTDDNQRKVGLNRYYKSVYGSFTTEVLDFTITYDFNGRSQSYKMNEGLDNWEHHLIVVDTADLVVTVTANDNLGNSSSKSFQYPPNPVLEPANPNRPISYQVIYLPAGIQNISGYKIIDNQGKEISERILDKDYDENYFYLGDELRFVYYNGKLASKIINYELGKYPWYTYYPYNPVFNEILGELTIESVEFGRMDGDYVDYTVTIPENDFDKVFVISKFTPNPEDNGEIDMMYFPKGKTVVKSKVKLNKVFPKLAESNYYIWGIKDSFRNYDNVSAIYTEGTPSITKGSLNEGENAIFYSSSTPVIDSITTQNSSYANYKNAFLSRFSDKSKITDYFLRYVNNYTHNWYPSADFEKINLKINGIDHVYENSVFYYSSTDEQWQNNIIFTPVWDIETNREKIQLEATGKNGKTGLSEITTRIWGNRNDVKFDDITKQDGNLILKNKKPGSGIGMSYNILGLFVIKYNQGPGWQLIKDYTNAELSIQSTHDYFTAIYPGIDETLPSVDNCFLKFISYLDEPINPCAYSVPVIYYTGTKGSGEYDLLMANGTSTKSVAIQSDAPVFVHTLTTKRPYEECKDWTAEKWEYMHRHLGEQQINFASDDHSARRYSIPVDQIDSGDYYVVIAHFSDNHTEMSQIMQK